MAEQDIIQNLIFQLGQSQDDRPSKELGRDFVGIDEQTKVDLLRLTKAFSEFVNYYRHNSTIPAGNWSNFFPDETKIEELLKSKSANTSPHLALFLTFLELYKQPQSIINNITIRHLDFYYQDVLRLKQKGAIADRVHLLLKLKKNVAPVRIGPEHLFSAGKDATNVELIYAPVRETIINAATIQSLRSLFFDDRGNGTIRYAPIANSADGLGGKLSASNPKWSGFGNPQLPPAEVGFAIASPVLRMQEGNRRVRVFLQLNNVDPAQLNNVSLNGGFDVFITGAKNWLGPFTISPKLSAGNELTFDFIVPETEQAVVDYQAAIHGYFYTSQVPIVQVLLKANNAKLGYKNFKNVTIQTARISVEVSNITSLKLENDFGAIDPKKAFLPFGPQPTKGSRFLVGYAEALAKKLSEISLILQWKDAPENFTDRYRNYEVAIDNNSFTATVSFQDGGSWVNTSYGVKLFNSTNAASKHTLKFPPSSSPAPVAATSSVTEGMKIYALSQTSSIWALNAAKNFVLQKPVFLAYETSVPEPQLGSIAFSLERDFLHSTYRQKYVENVMKYSKDGGELVILNEPYTPTIQSIVLSYKAHSHAVNISSNLLDDFANPDLSFFHIAYFGQMREHGYQRQQMESQLTAGINTAVPLVSSYNNAGEMLIGFGQLNPGDSVSVLFQVAEGSANPELESPNIDWFVLCDNYWKPLSRSEVVLDTTNQLLTSGIIQFVIPPAATTQNTILPSGLIWIKAAIQNNVTAVCQSSDVAANAIEVQFVDGNNDRTHLLTALEAGKITKLKNGISAIETVKQPYASFGGNAVESNSNFYTRVSERLRHKNRCLTAWDYERIILAAFPNVHKVKCIPHASKNSWLSPGHVSIVVVPDLKNKNAIDILEPKVDANTIDRITTYVQKRSGMQVKINVKNPNYQKIQVDFKVKFYPQYEFNYYKTLLDGEIVRFLSPWAYDRDREISFGGKVYKSVLLDFVEDLPYIDYVTDFKMYSFRDPTNNYTDINEVHPYSSDTILVSHPTHTINLAT